MPAIAGHHVPADVVKQNAAVTMAYQMVDCHPAKSDIVQSNRWHPIGWRSPSDDIRQTVARKQRRTFIIDHHVGNDNAIRLAGPR